MPDDMLTFEMVDRDGAIAEAAEEAGHSRGDFLRRAGVAAGGTLLGSSLFGGVAAAAAPKQAPASDSTTR
jgi:hypothetical protein